LDELPELGIDGAELAVDPAKLLPEQALAEQEATTATAIRRTIVVRRVISRS
jgi:hypothetical protein